MSYPIITLCGSYNLSKDWTLSCINSWHKIKDVDPGKFYLVPDDHLTPEDKVRFEGLGFHVYSKDNPVIDTFLNDYPTLKKIRATDLMWRKLLDPIILLAHEEKIILIDTDVYINDDVKLPSANFDIAYMRDDIPGYSADWKVVWQQAMVPALNAGMIVVNPKIVDFNFLEMLTKNYLIDSSNPWLTEQTAWACIAGRTKNRQIFSGNSVRVLSGLKKRTLTEIKNNGFKYVGSNDQIDDFEHFRPLLDGSSIIHFACIGKNWFKESVEHLSAIKHGNKLVNIETYTDKTMSLKDKLAISFRLFYKKLRS